MTRLMVKELASMNHGRSSGRIFFSRVFFLFFSADSYSLIQCWFYPCVTAVAHKRPRSFCQQCRWQDKPGHAFFLYPWPSEVKMGWLCYPDIALEPIRETSLFATHQGMFCHSRFISLSHCGLVLAQRCTFFEHLTGQVFWRPELNRTRCPDDAKTVGHQTYRKQNLLMWTKHEKL